MTNYLQYFWYENQRHREETAEDDGERDESKVWIDLVINDEWNRSSD